MTDLQQASRRYEFMTSEIARMEHDAESLDTNIKSIRQTATDLGREINNPVLKGRLGREFKGWKKEAVQKVIELTRLEDEQRAALTELRRELNFVRQERVKLKRDNEQEIRRIRIREMLTPKGIDSDSAESLLRGACQLLKGLILEHQLEFTDEQNVFLDGARDFLAGTDYQFD